MSELGFLVLFDDASIYEVSANGAPFQLMEDAEAEARDCRDKYDVAVKIYKVVEVSHYVRRANLASDAVTQ